VAGKICSGTARSAQRKSTTSRPNPEWLAACSPIPGKSEGDAKVGAKESGSEFRYELLDRMSRAIKRRAGRRAA
jgi:hypothetical protein